MFTPLRRRVGRGQLGRDLEKQPAQVALVANLRDPKYVRLLAGSLDQLPTAFARIDREAPTSLPELVRDHRDSQLQRVLRQLLEEPLQPPPSVPHDEQSQPPDLSAPRAEEVATSAQKLEELSDEEIRASTTPTIARERIRARLAAARRRGPKVGRPKALDDQQVEMARTLMANPNLSAGQLAEQLGVHRATLYRSLRSQ